MGIKTLNPFLKKKCPEAFKDIPYSFFTGKRVAVDSNNVLMKLMSRAHKEIVNRTDVCVKEPDRKLIVERWLEHLKDEISKFMRYGITLIFVFDGDYIDEKSETQAKRREDKKKRLSDAEEMKQKVLEMDELERTPQMVTDLRKKMHHLGTITSEDKELVVNFLKSMGLPVLFAKGEGEKLCAMMCIEGKVFAVYSRDTDIVAMGCPLSFSEDAGWIYNPQTQKTELALKCTLFKPILSSLEMEYSTFVDLCIMSGCDFNTNIYRLGIETAYKLLKECKNIENLPEKYQDKIEVLNHVRCREIFQIERSQDICKTEIVLNLGKLENEDLRSEFAHFYENFPIPSDLFIEKRPSISSSRIKLKIISEPQIPKQKASPKKYSMKSLASQQLERYKARN